MTVVDFGVRAILLSLALAMTGAAAHAQTDASGPMSTASGAAPPTPTAAPAPLSDRIAPEQTDPGGPPVRDGKMHGVVEASVGSDGSRAGMVAVDMPLKDGGDVQVAVAVSQGGRGRRLRQPQAQVQPQPTAN